MATELNMCPPRLQEHVHGCFLLAVDELRDITTVMSALVGELLGGNFPERINRLSGANWRRKKLANGFRCWGLNKSNTST